MIDRVKILLWWAGRLTDAEFAKAACMNVANVKWIFRHPIIQQGTTGGGRGKRRIRMLSPVIRNAIAIAETVRVTGMTMERAIKIVTSPLAYAERVNTTIDWVPDPNNIVDYHGFDIPIELFEITHGFNSLKLHEGLDGVLMRECDPLGFWDEDISLPVSGELDERLFIYDGEILSEDGPVDANSALLWLWRGRTSSNWDKTEVIARAKAAIRKRGETPVGRLKGDEIILWFNRDYDKSIQTEKPNNKKFEFLKKNFTTKLEINLTLPVRLMKRRFYGLKVDE